MLLELINLTKVRKAVIYAGIVILVFAIQGLVLSNIRIFGVSPMIIPILVIAIGFFEGGIWGGVFGILIGLFSDMAFNGATVMMTVLYPVLGFFAGAFTLFYMSRRIMPFFFLSLFALLITVICQMFKFLVFTNTDATYVILGGALQTLWSIPFIYAIYFPSRAVSRLDLSE